MSEPKTAPAIGYSLTCNLGGDRQIVFQCFVAEDESDESVNAKLDRMSGFADRLKARAELPQLREELEKHMAGYNQMIEDKARLDLDFEKSQASLDVQVENLNEQIANAEKAAQVQWEANGRRGAYTPTGSAKANIERFRTGIKAVLDDKAKNAAERDAAVSNYEITKKTWELQEKRLRDKIAEREAQT